MSGEREANTQPTAHQRKNQWRNYSLCPMVSASAQRCWCHTTCTWDWWQEGESLQHCLHCLHTLCFSSLHQQPCFRALFLSCTCRSKPLLLLVRRLPPSWASRTRQQCFHFHSRTLHLMATFLKPVGMTFTSLQHHMPPLVLNFIFLSSESSVKLLWIYTILEQRKVRKVKPSHLWLLHRSYRIAFVIRCWSRPCLWTGMETAFFSQVIWRSQNVDRD